MATNAAKVASVISLDVRPAEEGLKRVQVETKNTTANLKELSVAAKSVQEVLRQIQPMYQQVAAAYALANGRQVTATDATELRKFDILQKANAKQLAALEVGEAKKRAILAQSEQKILQGQSKFQKQMETMGKMGQGGTHGPQGTSVQMGLEMMVGMGLFMGAVDAGRALLETIKENEKATIDLQKVMSQTTDFGFLQEDRIKLAKEFGYTIKDVGDSQYLWAKQQKTQKELSDLTKTSLLAANVAEVDAAEATRFVTQATIQYNVAAADSIRIVDRANEVSNNYAVTAKDLFESVSRSGSVMNAFGVTLDRLNGYTAALAASTGRSGSEIGNALRSMAIFTYKPESIATFEKMGIAIQETGGGLRNLREVFDETAKRWDGLTQAEQNELANAAAGNYRRNYFIALMKNYRMAIDATITSETSYGSAMRENDRIMRSYAKKIEQLKGAIGEFAIAVGEAGLLDALKGATDGGRAFLEGFSKLPPALRNGVIWAGELTVALTTINIASKAFVSGGLTSLLLKIPGVTVATQGFGAALIAAAGTPIGMAIIALGALTTGLISYGIAQRQAREETLRQERTIIDFSTRYDLLTKRMLDTTLNAEEKRRVQVELNQVMQDLAQFMPQIVSQWDSEGKAIALNTEKLRENADAARSAQKEREQDDLSASASETYNLERMIDNKRAGKEKAKKIYVESGLSLVGSRDDGGAVRSGLEKSFEDQYAREINQLGQKFQLAKSRYMRAYAILYGSVGSRDVGAGRTRNEGAIFVDTQGDGGEDKGAGSGSGKTPYGLAIEDLESLKELDQVTTEQVIANLKRIRDTVVMTSDERKDITKRIYQSEKELVGNAYREALKEQEKETKDYWKRIYENQESALQKRIDALREESEEEIRIKQRVKEIDDEIRQAEIAQRKADRQQEIREAQNQLDELRRKRQAILDDTIVYVKDGQRIREADKEKLRDIDKEIAEAQKKLDKAVADDRRDTRKETLEAEKTNLEAQAKRISEERGLLVKNLQDALEAMKTNNKDQLASLDEYWTNRLATETINQEVERLVKGQGYTKMLADYKAYLDAKSQIAGATGGGSAVSAANAGVVRAKEMWAAAASRGDKKGLVEAEQLADFYRSTGATIPKSMTLDEARRVVNIGSAPSATLPSFASPTFSVPDAKINIDLSSITSAMNRLSTANFTIDRANITARQVILAEAGSGMAQRGYTDR